MSEPAAHSSNPTSACGPIEPPEDAVGQLPRRGWRDELLAAVADQLAQMPEAVMPSRTAQQHEGGPLSQPSADLEAPDLFSMLAELAALRQEVRLQSRTQERAARAMEQAHVSMQATAAAQAASQAAGERAAKEADAWRSRAQLAPFLDLRDMLERAIAHAASPPPPRPWWQAWRAPEGDRGISSLEALRVALDRTLAQVGVVPFAAVGDAFDPQTMVAVGRSQDPHADAGRITQVARGGFTCGGQLIRSAEVVVA